MTPDLRYTTTTAGRERESSARMGWKKNRYKIENNFSDKLHQQVITEVQWGYFDSKSPRDKSEQALIDLT